MEIGEFRQLILKRYLSVPRNFPWRETSDPYAILVSEIMLQQTQTERVVPKYLNFLEQFPTLKALAEAPASQLLTAWQGLGYNRRALALQKTAQLAVAEYGSKLPREIEELQKFPGIGPYTAAAVHTFAFDLPAVFIETNIRRVFIHFFFEPDQIVHDKELFPLIEKALPKENFREWYWALMDYGAYLAKTLPNPNRRSKHYTKQSKFEGSNRQLRGKVLKTLLTFGRQSLDDLGLRLQTEKDRLLPIIQALEVEGFLNLEDTMIDLSNS